MYKFWHKKVSPLIKDPKKRAILAPPPEKAPHTFGTVRPSLQRNYYDILNQPNVDVVSVKDNPIVSFTEKGVKLADGTEKEFDVICLATGYDTHTGGFAQIDIRGSGGKPLGEHWKEGCKSYLGVATSGFPNMYFMYGPHAPTAYSNGPSTTDCQCEWILKFIEDNEKSQVKSAVALPDAESKYCQRIWDLSAATLFHSSHGWYMGRNVKGKVAQPLNYTGGIPAYIKDLEESSNNGYAGWTLVK